MSLTFAEFFNCLSKGTFWVSHYSVARKISYAGGDHYKKSQSMKTQRTSSRVLPHYTSYRTTPTPKAQGQRKRRFAVSLHLLERSARTHDGWGTRKQKGVLLIRQHEQDRTDAPSHPPACRAPERRSWGEALSAAFWKGTNPLWEKMTSVHLVYHKQPASTTHPPLSNSKHHVGTSQDQGTKWKSPNHKTKKTQVQIFVTLNLVNSFLNRME